MNTGCAQVCTGICKTVYAGWKTSKLWLPALVLAFGSAHAESPEPLDGADQDTVLTETPSGKPMVNIDNPNNQGLSHNLYERFDVDAQGLILNNSRGVADTKQAGHITANPNLTNGPADVILNEVVRSNPSSLRGYMEVGGPAANVVLANPWGITCNGCGFINTNRATLTTGEPQLHNGMLNGFSVDQGRVTFAGEGLNAGNVDSLDIIARSVKLNAELHGSDIRMVTGTQDVDYSDLNISDVRDLEGKPEFAISSNAFGGIYGDRIEMIANEDGVGVNLEEPVAALTGNLAINARGKLEYNRLSADGDMTLQASEMTAAGDTTAGGHLGMGADRIQLSNSAVSAQTGGISTDTLTLGEDANLAFNEDANIGVRNLDNAGWVHGTGKLNLFVTDRLTNTGGISSNAHLFTNPAELDNAGGALQSSDSMDLELDAFEYEGEIQADGSLAIQAANDIHIGSGKEWKVLGNMSLATTGEVLNEGVASSAAGLSINADTLENDGDLAGQGGLTIQTNTLKNRDGSLLLSGSGTDIGVNVLENRGDIYGLGDMRIKGPGGKQSRRVDNISGLIGSHSANTNISADIVTNQRSAEPEVALVDTGKETEYGIIGDETDDGKHKKCFKKSRKGVCRDFTAKRNTIFTRNAEVTGGPRPGLIYAGKNLDISGSRLTNKYSDIEASGNIKIDVDILENLNFSKTVKEKIRIDKSWHFEYEKDFRSDDHFTATTLDASNDGSFCRGRSVWLCHDWVFLTSDGKNIYTIRLHDDQLKNIKKIDRGLVDYKVKTTGGTFLAFGYTENREPSFSNQSKKVSLVDGVIKSGGDVAINAHEYIDNGTEDEGADVSIGKAIDEMVGDENTDIKRIYRRDAFADDDWHPSGNYGLFKLNGDPDHHYRIVTNPLFDNHDDFMGSIWMLNHLGWDADGAMRLLGDGFYELDLLRKSLRGTERSLAGADYDEQKARYRELMNNGLAAAEELELAPGVSLTAEQINQLEQDLVWPEKEEVAGETVMVPVVYFAGGSEVQPDGPLISGENIDMESDGIRNNGRIKADSGVNIKDTDGNLINGGVVDAGDSIDMEAEGDIRNESGTISSPDVYLDAGGDIINERLTGFHDNGETWFTALGDQARITGSDRLILEAAGDITFSGGDLDGGRVELDAGGDVRTDTVELRYGHDSRQGRLKSSADTTQHLTSSLSSTLDMLVEADEDIDLIGTRVASEQDIDFGAGGDFSVTTARDSHSYSERTNHDEMTTARQGYSISHQRALFDAGGELSLESEGDMSFVGAELNSGGDIRLGADGDLTMASAKDVQYNKSFKKEDKWYGSKSRTSESYNEDVISTSMEAGNNILINADLGEGGVDLRDSAEGDVTLEGVQAQAGGEVVGYAGGEMNVLPAASSSYEHSETSRSYSGVAKGLAGATALSLEAIAPGASGAIDPKFDASKSRGKGGSSLTATTIDSGSGTTLLAGDDANIVAGDIGAGKDRDGEVNPDELGLGDLSVEAGLDKDNEDGRVRIMGARENEYSYARESSMELGAEFSGNKMSIARKKNSSHRTEKQDWIGSGLDATRNMDVKAAGDVDIVGSELDAAADLGVESGGDINVLTGSDISRTRKSRSTREYKVEGTSGDSSAELFAGYEQNRHIETSEERSSVASSLTGKNVRLESERDINVAGSDVEATGKMTENGMEGGNLTLNARRHLNTREGVSEQTQTIIDENFRTGISVTARENLSSAERSVRNARKASNNLNRVSSTLQAVDSLSAARTGGVTSSAGLVAEWSRTEQTSTSQQARPSTLTSANNMTLKSGGNQHHSGTRALALNNMDIDSGGKVTFSSAQNRSDLTSTSKNASTNIGLSGESGVSVTMAGGEANAETGSVQQINANFTAINTASITSEGDTKLKGAAVRGQHMETDIGGDLTVDSRQDTSHVDADSVQGSVTVGTGSPSASISVSETEGDRAWIEQQSGLFAADRADIHVEEHTDLNGGAIHSETGNMTLDTETLSYRDIQNHDEQTTTSLSVGLSVPQGQTEGASDTAQGDTVIPGTRMNNLSIGYENSETEQVTRATLGEGKIKIRDKAGSDSLKGLNRDMDDAREIIHEEEEKYNFYVSDSSLRNMGIMDVNDKEGDGSQLAALANTLDVRDAVDDMGDSVNQGINELDDTFMAGFSLGTRRESEVLDKTLNQNDLFGLIPSLDNNGGLLGQIDVLLGNEDKLHQERVAVKEGRKLLENNRDKFVRMENTAQYDEFNEDQKDALYGFYISKQDAEFSEDQYTKFNFTNGMRNHLFDAVINGKEQTASGAFTVNYNPSYGGVADLMESAQDMIFGAWAGNLPGIGQLSASFLTSGISEQTARFVERRVNADNNTDYTMANHSQGNTLFATALNSGIYLADRDERMVKVTSYGSPVNVHNMREKARESGFRLVGMKSKEGDFVAETLGRNFGEFNGPKGKEAQDASFYEWVDSSTSFVNLFSGKWPDKKGDTTSAHSTYKCIASCGNLQ